MASAVLASRNEPTWGQSTGGFMGKFSFSNPHLNPNPKPNPNPNPNFVSKRKTHAPAGQINGRHINETPAVTQSTSEDAYSFNRKSTDHNNRGGVGHGGYVTFNIASYTGSELSDLKRRLIGELEQIRNLSNHIESGAFQLRSGYKGKGSRVDSPTRSAKNKKKRPLQIDSNRDSKRLATEITGTGPTTMTNKSMKLCGQLLTKLMKHKHSWIFNSPVDVVGMGLHDYHQIIKRPMDLGTVKSKLGKNLYASPSEFASEVRLTFDNALLYNPKGHDVYVMAEQLLARFEDMFRPINESVVAAPAATADDELQESSWYRIQSPERERAKKPNPMPILSKQERMQIHATANPSSHSQSPVPTPSPVRAPPVKPMAARAISVKQPKPKARDPNKREMSLEEKHRLGSGLQSLPQEKMEQVVQIIRKRNGHLTQEGDEIELDIEAVDTETLWELDRFVTNWKKMMSKIRRQGLISNNTSTTEDNGLPESERIDATAAAVKKPKKGETGEEDVDIGDEIPMSSFPPVEIEKDDGHATSSSSSSSGSSSDSSSSSSDSDSGSSSGSDSDADNAQSKEFSKT